MPSPSRFLVVLVAVTGLVIGAATGAAWATFTRTATASHSVSTATLAPPTGLSATSSATLSWTATTSSYATGTRVYRSTTSGGPYTQIAQIAGLATTTYADSPGSGTFYYVVKAYYGANWTSVDSNQATAITVPIAFVQTATGGGTAATITATYATTPVAGNLLVAIAATRLNGTLTAPLGWSTAINQSGGPSQAVFYKIAGALEPRPVAVVTTAGGTGNALQLFEYSGVTTFALAGSATGTSNTLSSGSVTTTTARSLLVAGVVGQQGGSFTGVPTNSFTGRNGFTQGAGGAQTLFGSGDRMVATTGTYSTSTTASSSGAWRGQIVAFN